MAAGWTGPILGGAEAAAPDEEMIRVASIRVTPTDAARVYDVEIDADRETSRHRVTVPSDVAGAGLPETEPERLVRESVAFLLEREPVTAILAEFDLTVITRYFPEYPGELQRRLG